MGLIFGNDKNIRGCFTVLQADASNGRGAQLDLPTAGLLPTNDYADPLLVIGFQLNVMESVLYNKCFGNRVYTYAFGHDPFKSNFAVNFIGFLVDKTQYSKVVEDFSAAYRDSRVSASKDFATLVLGESEPLTGFVRGFTSQTIDPQHSLQQFTMLLDIPEF